MDSPVPSSPSPTPTPRFTAASAGTSPLSRNQKLGLLVGATALILLLVVSGLIFGVSRGKHDANKDKVAQGTAIPTPLPVSPDAGRQPDNPDSGSPLPTPSVGPAAPPATPTGPGVPVVTDQGTTGGPTTPGVPAIPSLVTAPAAHPATPAAHTAIHQIYAVRENDSLWSIAKRTYGNGEKWTLIAQANPGLTPEKLRVGMKINLPDLAAAGTHPGARTAAAAHPAVARLHPRSVTVQEGDTLYNIARKVYGNGEKWDLIYHANQDKLTDPDQLPAGVQLTIPAS